MGRESQIFPFGWFMLCIFIYLFIFGKVGEVRKRESKRKIGAEGVETMEKEKKKCIPIYYHAFWGTHGHI